MSPQPTLRVVKVRAHSPERPLFGPAPGVPLTDLEHEALARFNRGREQAGRPLASMDPRLGDVARAYAQLLVQGGPELAAAAVEPLLDWAGLIDVYPTFHARESPMGGDAPFLLHLEGLGRARAVLEEQEEEPGKEVLGFGRCIGGESWTHVAVVLRRMVEIEPISRVQPPGAGIRLRGRLAPGLHGIEAFVLRTPGRVEPAGIELRPGKGFELRWDMPSEPGRLLVELTGQTARGPRVLARFSLLAVDPGAPEQVLAGHEQDGGAPLCDPLLLLGSGIDETEEGREPFLQILLPPEGDHLLDAPAASRRFLDLVNLARGLHLAPALQEGRLASAVARQHARDMAGEGFTGHLSVSSGDPGERFRQAGLALSILGECLARDRSITLAYLALMRSLSHRSLLLDSRFLTAGVGVEVLDQGSHREYLVTCDLLRPLEHPSPGDGAAELVREISMLRARRGAPPLMPHPVARSTAHALAIALADPAWRDGSRVSMLLDQEMQRADWGDYGVLIRGLLDPLSIASEEEALDPRWTHLGVAIRELHEQPTIPVIIVVVVLGSALPD